jgi:non-heme chloroperoxidase
MSRGGTLALGAVGAAAVGAVVATRHVERRWSSGDDPCAPADRVLPAGASHVVATDDGAELAVTVAGAGPTVVLAHCWTGGREVWAPVAHRLVRRGHQVVLYDQRGHGSSTVGTDGFTIPRLGADLRAVLDGLDVRDAVVAGHSMGGMAVQSLATHHLPVVEQRARALVLVATAASGLGRGRRDGRATRAVASPSLERLLRSRIGHALVRGSVGAAVHRDHLVLTRDLFVACPPASRSGWLSAMQAMDLRDGVAAIGIPTTVLVGTHDRLTPPERAAELASAIPGARLATLDGRGHMLPLEAPDEVADALAEAAAPTARS